MFGCCRGRESQSFQPRLKDKVGVFTCKRTQNCSFGAATVTSEIRGCIHMPSGTFIQCEANKAGKVCCVGNDRKKLYKNSPFSENPELGKQQLGNQIYLEISCLFFIYSRETLQRQWRETASMEEEISLVFTNKNRETGLDGFLD